MTQAPTTWRSMLFVPANVERFIAKAPDCGADAVILDLEDSVLASAKSDARLGVRDAARSIASRGTDVFVRVNRPWRSLLADVEATVDEHVTGIMLPKADDAGLVRMVDELLTELEEERALPVGHTSIHVLIESPRGLTKVDDILGASNRVVAASAGLGDLAFAAGFAHDSLGVHLAHLTIATAAMTAGCLPMGLAALGVDFDDLDEFRRLARFSRDLGSVGSVCIHPRQVPVLNEVFQPSAEEIDWAESILDAFESADRDGAGRGAFMLGGQFVDVAMTAKARTLIAAKQALQSAGRWYGTREECRE